MAFLQQRHLTTGELIRGTFAELRDNARPVLIYLAVMLASNLAAESNPIPVMDDVLGLAQLAIFFAAQYLLFEALLHGAQAIHPSGRRRFFRFVGQAFVVLFVVLFAANFFVFPGFIVGARWIMAPGLLVSGRCGAMGALGESWHQTHGNTAPIAFAAALLMLLACLATMLVGGIATAINTVVGAPEIFGQTLLLAMNLTLVGLSVTVYKRLYGETDELAAVFA